MAREKTYQATRLAAIIASRRELAPALGSVGCGSKKAQELPKDRDRNGKEWNAHAIIISYSTSTNYLQYGFEPLHFPLPLPRSTRYAGAAALFIPCLLLCLSSFARCSSLVVVGLAASTKYVGRDLNVVRSTVRFDHQ